MRETPVCTAADAIYKLAAGNLKYLNAENGSGDISRRIRMSTWAKGQSPYAIIVTCSDSRVIPENIFSAGIGPLVRPTFWSWASRASSSNRIFRPSSQTPRAAMCCGRKASYRTRTAGWS